MRFGWDQTVQRSRFFPCNAIDLMLKLSIALFGEGQLMVSEPLGGTMVPLPAPLDPSMVAPTVHGRPHHHQSPADTTNTSLTEPTPQYTAEAAPLPGRLHSCTSEHLGGGSWARLQGGPPSWSSSIYCRLSRRSGHRASHESVGLGSPCCVGGYKVTVRSPFREQIAYNRQQTADSRH